MAPICTVTDLVSSICMRQFFLSMIHRPGGRKNFTKRYSPREFFRTGIVGVSVIFLGVSHSLMMRVVG